jgi:biotin carboxyl carrier protein
MGIPLHRIPDVRSFYGEPERHGSSEISFSTAARGEPKRYVIAARITAEDPSVGFRPTSGMLQELNFRNSPHVWGYFSVFGRGSVHEYSDSQFGHIFASGGSRESARKHMIMALKELTIYGEIRTTVSYLTRMLELEDYKNNKISTEWLDRLLAEGTISPGGMNGDMQFIYIVCGAVVKANAALNQLRTEAVTALEYGRVPPSSLMCTQFPVELVFGGVKYCIKVTCTDSNMFALEMNNSVVYADTRLLSDNRLLVFIDGKSYTVFTREEVNGLRMQINGQTVMFEKENDPTKLRASTTGKLVRFLIPNGSHAEPGTAYADMEVMKMYMQLETTHSGKIFYASNPESYVKAGDVLANVELDDCSCVTTAQIFRGVFPKFVAPHLPGWRCHQHLREAIRRAEAVLAGFTDPAFREEDLQADIVNQLFLCMKDPSLPYLEMQEAFNTVKAALPAPLISSIGTELQEVLAPLLKSPVLKPDQQTQQNVESMGPTSKHASAGETDMAQDVHNRKLLDFCKVCVWLNPP